LKFKFHNSAVSEIIGTMILLIIAVSVVTFVFFNVFSNLKSSEDINVEIVAKLDHGLSAIILEHHGGDPLGSKTNIIFDIGSNHTEFLLEEISGNIRLIGSDGTNNGLDDNKWSIGERLIYPINIGGQYIAVKVGDQSTNKLVMFGTLQEGYIGQGGIWPLDECSGIYTLDITNRNDPAQLRYDPEWNSSNAKVNCSIYFPGFSSKVDVQDSYSLDIVDNITIMAWMLPLEETYIIQSIQLDQKFGMTPWMIHAEGNIYSIVSENQSKGGILSTFNISNKGKISEKNADFNFGNSTGNKLLRPVIINVNDNFYSVGYLDKNHHINIKTFRIKSNNGSIEYIDNITFNDTDPNINSNNLNKPSLCKISDNMIAISYRDTYKRGIVKTVNISNDGQLNYTNKSWIFDDNICYETKIINCSNGIFAITYRGPGNDGIIKTMKIYSNNGTIKSTEKEHTFETNQCYEPDIINISNQIFAITYRGPGGKGIIKTMKIYSNNGTIKSTEKEHTFESNKCYDPDIIHYSLDSYAIAYATGNSGKTEGILQIVGIYSNGSFDDTNIVKFLFHDDKTYFPSINKVNDNIFAIAFEGDQAHPGNVMTIAIGLNIDPPINRGIFKSGSYSIYSNMSTIFGSINNHMIFYDVVVDPDWNVLWNHVTMTYDGINISLYLNGKWKKSVYQPGSINETDSDLIIGEWYHGFYDEIAIYDEALNAVEINNHYSIPGYWILDD